MEIPDLIGVTIKDRYDVIKKLGEGGFGFTYQVYDSKMDRDAAIKILKNDDDDFSWKEEAKKAGKLQGIPQIVTITDYDDDEIKLNDKKIHINYIVSEFINGEPLADFIEKHPLTSIDMVNIIEQICIGISAMQNNGIEHGDLHMNNILITEPQQYDPENRRQIKIVDFGLAKSLHTSFTNDIDAIYDILLICYQRNQYYAGESIPSEKKFNKSLSKLMSKLNDTNIERKIKNPNDIVKQIKLILEDSTNERIKIKTTLDNPFDYLNVEEIPENSDLLSYLYIDSVPWLKEITQFGTIMLSGPRGSGKSMVLKNMRLLTKLASKNFNKKSLSDLKYFGFYVHCVQNIHNPLAGLSVKYDTDDIKILFIHYMNLLFLSEILETIKILEKKRMIYFSKEKKRNLENYLMKKVFNDDYVFLSSNNSLEKCKTIIEKEIILAQQHIIDNKRLGKMTTISFLSDIINFLDGLLDIFKYKKIYFILDDFSSPKIKSEIQKSINQIIAQRNERFCFKISTEKFGYQPVDSDGKILMQDREFCFIDLGAKYINFNTKERKEFVREIIQKRIHRAHNRELPEDFFEDNSINLPKLLLNENKEKSSVKYFGFDAIYNLCMGDLSTILDLCKRLYSVKDTTITKEIQNEIITEFSRSRVEIIKALPLGDNLYEIVNSFADISKNCLQTFSNKNNDEYYELLSFDINKLNCLSGRSEELFRKLIEGNIFLDGSGSFLDVGKTNNMKLFLRPIFTPYFNISYYNKHSLSITCQEFRSFLEKPMTTSRKIIDAYKPDISNNLSTTLLKWMK